MVKTTKTVEVDVDTFAQITHLAKALSMPKKTFLSLLIGEVFDIGSQFDKGLVILYSGAFNAQWLKLNFIGRSSVVLGTKKVESGEDANPIFLCVKHGIPFVNCGCEKPIQIKGAKTK